MGKITIVNIYVPNVSKSNFTKQILLDLNALIDPSTTLMGDFSNLTFTNLDRSSGQKIIK
jgi:hypothetical protein